MWCNKINRVNYLLTLNKNIMASYGEGTVEIPLNEFWEFVAKYNDIRGAETLYGVPRPHKGNGMIEIDFAFSTECKPVDWAEKSEAQKQWDELDK
jgi:hypothetical protein